MKLSERMDTGTYKQLRAIELMCAEYEFDESIKGLVSIVKRPAYFCSNTATLF